MRTEINVSLAKRRRQFTTYLFIFTIIVLIGSFVLINQSLLTGQQDTSFTLLLQILSLPVAFALTLLSVRMTNLWARDPRPEKAIADGLKGLSKKSVIYHYYHMPARHVLIAPQGVFAIVTRWHTGKYAVDGDDWQSHQGAFSRVMSFMRMDGIGNPTRDALRAAEHLKKELEPIAPDVDVQPLILFVNPMAELEINDPTVPVLYTDPKSKPNLTDHLREISRSSGKTEMPLTEEQIQEFEQRTVES